MAMGMQSLLRETVKLFIQYLGVGFASIPAGIIYYFLTEAGLNPNVALVIVLCVGLATAHLAWRFTDKRIFPPRKLEQAMIQTAIKTGWSQQPDSLLTGTLTACVFIGIAAPPPSPRVYRMSAEVYESATSNIKLTKLG
jgi:hypothetical protein